MLLCKNKRARYMNKRNDIAADNIQDMLKYAVLKPEKQVEHIKIMAYSNNNMCM